MDKYKNTQPKVRSGIKLIHRFRAGVKVIGITTWHGELWIATERGVYRKTDFDARLKKIKNG